MSAVGFNPSYFFSGSSHATTPLDNKLRYIASGRKEGFEHRRNFFYSPKHESISRQTDVTGFAEAVTNFTDNFVGVNEAKAEFPFRIVSTKKSEQIYILVENCEYIVGTSLIKQQCASSDYPIVSQAICTVVRDAYKMFRLFFGTFEEMRKKSEDEFRERLEYFFSRYLHTLKLHKMPLLDWLEGCAFLQLDSKTYLRIVTLMDELVEEFPLIEKVVVLYQYKLLYYTVSPTDLPSLFRYLTQNLLPSSVETELEPSRSGHGRYLRGPQDLNLDRLLQGDDALPNVHLHVKTKDEETVLTSYTMMAYRILNATVCMFAKGEVTSRMLRNIDGFFGTDMSSVASDIGEYVEKYNNDNRSYIDFHYIYFNPSSLSLTSSFEGSNTNSRIAPPPLEVSRLLCETMKNFMWNKEEFGECYVKSDNEWWIVLKKANSRLLCLIIPPSSSQQSLIDIQGRATGIIKSHFGYIFLTN